MSEKVPEHAIRKGLSPRAKVLYGVGDTGFSLTTTIIGAYFLIFLTDVVGVPPGVAAIAIFVGKSWDYINDPIIGHLSDRTRTRWGRRRPYLLFGPLPFALAFAMLWWRPPWDDVPLLASYYALAYIVFDTAASLVYMPYFALTPELTSDYDERTSLTTYRMFFSILGSLIAFTVPLLIIGTLEPGSAQRALTMGVLFSVMSAVPLFLVFIGTRERQEHMNQKKPDMRQSLRAAVRNRPFLIGLAIFLVTWVAIDLLQATLLFFVKYAVQRQDQSEMIMGTIFVTAILALPLWAMISRRWSKRWAYIAGAAFLAGVLMTLITLSPATDLILILLLCLMAGIGVAAAHVLPWSMIPDAIEWGEWKTGERYEGMFYSLVTLTHKATVSLSIPAVGLILQFTGYVPNATQQSKAALLGIRISFGPLPAALMCLGIQLAILYPLGRQEYAQIVHELEEGRSVPVEDVP
jgi:GPH family glycoside/pentoside/hexuronide:cation symporter